MLNEQMEEALNQQVNREFYSAYLYLAMSAHFEEAGLPGFAAWMRIQAREETEHAMRFFDFIVDRGGRVRLVAVAEPPADFGSPLQAFEQALEHERSITAAIEGLYAHSDRASEALLQWFMSEQVEEERTVGQIVDTLRLGGESGPSLLIVDRELGARGKA